MGSLGLWADDSCGATIQGVLCEKEPGGFLFIFKATHRTLLKLICTMLMFLVSLLNVLELCHYDGMIDLCIQV